LTKQSDPFVMRRLKARALELTFTHKLSHLSSVLNAIPVLYDIYKTDLDAICILSAGHAGLAQYVVLEHFKNVDAEELLNRHGIHPNRDVKNHIYCSTGSLGSGLPIAVGFAIANPAKKIYCLMTDGECAEGSIWESLRFINVKAIGNLMPIVIINGQSAYEYLSLSYLESRLQAFLPRIKIELASSYLTENINGLLSHYRVMDQTDYNRMKYLIETGVL